MENYCSSSRAEAFPAGLRVLVVDDDPTWLKILEKMLRKCSYEVTTCGLARTALDMLRERKERFDIVISDVNMPDMDGFKLLEQVGLEMDLPVIMMSVDGETSRVMKGVQHGACDYLLKPVRMKELRNIWQHVFRKRMHELKEVESHDSNELSHLWNKLEEFDEWQILGAGEMSSAKKRKDVDKEHVEQDSTDTASVKKARVVWSVDLHQKFVNAVDQIGFENVGPKKILDLMNVPGLTRENVASHLQKYRLYLSRLQKQNEEKMLGEIVRSDISCNEPPGKFGVHSPSATEKNKNSDSYGIPARKMQHQDMIPKICEDDLTNIATYQATATRNVMNNETNDFHKLGIISEFGVGTSSEDRIPCLDYNQNEICVSKNHQSGFVGDTVVLPMKQDQDSITHTKSYSQFHQLREDRYFGDHHLHPPRPVNLLTTTTEDSSPSPAKSTCTFERDHARTMDLACSIDLVSSQIEQRAMSTYHLEAATNINGHMNTKAFSCEDNNNLCIWDSPSKLDLKAEIDVCPFDDWFPNCLQDYGCFESIGLNSLDVCVYNDQTPTTTDHQNNFLDELQCNCEYLFDLPEFPTVDGGLLT